MSAHSQTRQADPRSAPGYKLMTNRIGLWLFFISDGFVFTGLLVARFYLLGAERPHLEQLLGLIVTSVLLISSFFMNRAEVSIAHGDRKNFVTSISITIAAGDHFPGGRGRVRMADRPVWTRRWAGRRGLLHDDRDACPACLDRGDFLAHRAAQWVERPVYGGTPLGRRSSRQLLALRGCRLDLFLPGAVLNRNRQVICRYAPGEGESSPGA